VKEVTPKDRNDLINDYAREEQNMFYLRHPYLTIVSLLFNYLINGHLPTVITHINVSGGLKIKFKVKKGKVVLRA
jgi:hypothetical protein